MEGARLGPYQVLTELGSGGMGKVYRAEVVADAAGLGSGTAIALKVIHAHLLESPGFFKRFLREADIGRTIQHENVVRTYDCDALLHEGIQQNFLVMEYVEGQTLRDLLKELERVPEELCRHIGHEVAKGLAAIHEAGVVHRDLKPENVLITKEHVVKVMDLGVARLQDEAIRLSQAGAFVGSLEYAAPEQFLGADGAPDGRADLHALGVVLYELSTGQHPYRDEDASKVLRNILDEEPRKAGAVNPQLSPFFEEVIHTLIAKDAEERFAAASELALVFEEGEKSRWWKERATELRLRTQRPLRRIRIPRETALHGRSGDLARLQSLYEKAKAGDGQVVLVGGEAGIGKTRLVDEFVGRLRQAGEEINFLFGSYPPGGAATASGAFSAAYRQQFGGATLEQVLADYLVETPLLIPAFAALLSGDATPTGAVPLTKDSLQTVFVNVTRGLAAERTTVVLIDDLHFAPEDGRALFASLAMALPGHRVLLVGTSRPGLAEDWVANLERIGYFSRMPLSRLGPKDLINLLRESFRSERLAGELGAQIALKSDGNPFFTFEIIKGLREGQFITQRSDGTWASTQVIQGLQIPSSVMDLIQARLVDLSEEEKDLLDVASCCGFEFDPLLVGAVLGLAQIPTMKLFARIERRHRLVRSSGRRYAFDHHQVQEALYRGMPELLREPYHAKLGAALEARSKVPDGTVAVELCEHFLAGGDGEGVLRHLPVAMQHLADGYLHDEAIALGQRALAVEGLLSGPGRVDLLLRNAASLELRGRHAEDRAALEEALALVDAAGDPAARARVRIQLGRLHIWLSESDAASEWLVAARDLAREAGDDALEGTALGNLGIVHYRQRAFDAAEPMFRLARERASERGDRRSVAVGTLNLGNVFLCRGQFDLAREHYERYREVSREIGYRQGEALAVGNLGNVLLSLGRLADARASYEEMLPMAAAIGDRRLTALFSTSLAAVDVVLGRFGRARETLEGSLALAREIGLVREETYALMGLAEIDDQEGAFGRSRELLKRARRLSYDLGEGEGVVHTSITLGRRALAEGREEEAARELDAALSAAREAGMADAEVRALCLQALLPGGDASAALEALTAKQDALGVSDRMDVHFLLYRVTGRKPQIQAAHDLLTFLVEHAPEDCRESMLRNVRLPREVQQAWEECGEAAAGEGPVG